MKSHINNFFIAQMVQPFMVEPWVIVPVVDWTPRSNTRAIALQDIPDDSLLGAAQLSLSWDGEFACAEATHREVVFENVGNMATNISGFALFARDDLMACWIGRDQLNVSFKATERDGNLVIRIEGEHPLVWGLPDLQ